MKAKYRLARRTAKAIERFLKENWAELKQPVRSIASSALLALFAVQVAFAGLLTDQLGVQIDRVVKVLEDPALKASGRAEERHQVIRGIADEIFDWPESAKHALGRYWEERTQAEREEFVTLYRDLLERAYVSKIELYRGEKISYIGEIVDGTQATVRTRITTKRGADVPVEYRMRRGADRWRVYDVVIENISLVSSYRAQFSKIIQRSSYQELVEEMKTAH